MEQQKASGARPFRIAHFSDPHLGPLPPLRPLDLMGKRLTGFINWHQARKGIHDMALFARVAADIGASDADLVLCGGDIANIGLEGEFARARAMAQSFGVPGKLLIVPGNHDAYTGASFGAMRRHLGPWMAGDAGEPGAFPFVARRAGVAVVGLNSGAPSLPFYATGRLGASQLAATRALLRELGEEGLFRVILVHHAPHVGGSRVFRNLIDAPAFERMLVEAGAELVLHGHNHRTSLAWRPGPKGPVPIVGVGSASAAGGTHGHRATWNRIDIADGAATVTVRQAGAAAGFTETPLPLTPDGAATRAPASR